MNFYTSVELRKNYILLRGVENEKRIKKKIRFKPSLFVESKKPDAKYRTIDDKPVERIQFEDIYDARGFIKEHENYYGFDNLAYQFINEKYPKVNYSVKHINVGYIDIEVAADEGFPDIELANKPITAITIRKDNIIVALGCGDFTPPEHEEKVIYVKCSDENDLILKFLKVWEKMDLDIVSGWNIGFFDIPYMVNRFRRIIGEEAMLRLSPWGIMDQKKVEIRGREYIIYFPLGIAIIDYLDCYKKFVQARQESYKLDYIAFKELKEKKLDYSEYDSLLELYKKNFQLFMEYNVRDVTLVYRLEKKLKFIELVMAMTYDAKINFKDALGTVTMWDCIIHNYLLEKNIVIPPMPKDAHKDKQSAGAFVKEPRPGMYGWIVSFDFTSLYPMLIQMFNISNEMYFGQLPYGLSIDEMLSGGLDRQEIRDYLTKHNVALTAGGALYKRDKQGFLSVLMEEKFRGRKTCKDKMLDVKKELQTIEDTKLKQEKEDEAVMWDKKQNALKVQINSAYGALSNSYFRWFDVKHAEAITLSGQLAIKWITQNVNIFLNEYFKTKNVDYIIAADTDSMYLDVDRYMKDKVGTLNELNEILNDFCKKVLRPKIDQLCLELAKKLNAHKNTLEMKHEANSNKGFWTGKKRYVINVIQMEGVVYDEPKIKVTGLEAVRSTTPAFCREKIKEAFNIIINKDEATFIDFIAQTREEFMKLGFEDIAIPKGCNNIAKYSDHNTLYKKATPIHVRGSILYNDYVKKLGLQNNYEPIREGDKVKYCYLTLPNPLHEDCISIAGILPKQFGLHQYIDYSKQFEKVFLEPLRKIGDCIGWCVEKQASLDQFF